MLDSIILFCIAVSFLGTLIALPLWIRKAKNLNLLWEDMNKFGFPRNVAASGGVVVIFSFAMGILLYVAFKIFLEDFSKDHIVEIFAALSVILILTIVGLIDDLFGWKEGGLSKRFRIFLALIASIPLVVINAGNPTLEVPFLGVVNFGLFYPLIIVPITIMGFSITFNFLAGFNGVETGQGILILSFLSFIAYATGSPWLAFVGIIMVSALVGFYIFNKYPAKVFPGDSLTWSIGALIAIMAILGNFERIALFVFIPYIIEFILKARGRLKKQSFGKPNADGSLEMPYNKIYGLTHLSIWILKKVKKSHKAYEWEVSLLINTFQIIIIALAVIIFL